MELPRTQYSQEFREQSVKFFKEGGLTVVEVAFYDYPAENWQYIRTTNLIESVFATVRLRTARTKNCGSRITTLTMAFKLMETAQKKWFRLRGYHLLADVINRVKFVNGIKHIGDQK